LELPADEVVASSWSEAEALVKNYLPLNGIDLAMP
jgi:hypothetical protein